MRGTRFSRTRRRRVGLFAILLLAATICGLTAAHYSGDALFARGGIPEAAAATSGPAVTPEPTATPAPSATTDPNESMATPEPPATQPPAEPSPPPVQGETSDDRKLVALTFDDGPDGKYTPQVLDILQEYGVKGTFFLVGPQVDKYPDTANRILDEGHSIGNHTWSHKDLTKLTDKEISEQIDKTQQAIADVTGFTPSLMRAPYGAMSDALLDALHERGMSHVYWTVDTRDWAGTSVADMRKDVRSHAKPGAIILMHSFGGRKNALEHTLALLPLIIEDLKAKGFEFVTVEEMIDAGKASKSVVK
ncbi:polysaccharide deacetylase family protein [Cohnella sp. GCM10027633]|uniref:polysaccharide deacetylase family protein n=1 Tax=unclassified Cohnella TaxID=2636738 RepID=UPI00362AE361